jgi:cytidine deaminase
MDAKQQEALLARARDVMQRAYAPYSQFQVGAALVTSNGRVFTGCNVENASYGLTICAERNAIFAAVADTGTKAKLQITAIAVCNSRDMACSPCGACRQVIAEFSTPQTIVFYQAKDGIKQMSMGELLPDCFSF